MKAMGDHEWRVEDQALMETLHDVFAEDGVFPIGDRSIALARRSRLYAGRCATAHLHTLGREMARALLSLTNRPSTNDDA